MTELRTAAELALEACTDAVSGWQSLAPLAVRRAAEAALDDLRAALAEPENWELRRLREELERCKQVCAATSEAWREESALAEPVQEPAAWMYHGIRHDGTPHDRPSLIWRPEYMDAMSAKKGAKATPLYAAPPQRKPLSDADLAKIWDDALNQLDPKDQLRFIARAIERAHGIKE